MRMTAIAPLDLEDHVSRIASSTGAPRGLISPRAALRSSVLLLALLAGLVAAPPAQAQCFLTSVWTVSESDSLLRRVSLETLTVEETIDIQIPGQVITGITGISIEPSTGNFWLLAYFSGVAAPFLLYHDPVNSFTGVAGNTFLDFITMEFEPSGELLAVSGDTATPPNSLCTLSLITGAPLDVCSYGNGDEGEAIAYHVGEARMYHASGALALVFETEDPAGTLPCNVVPIDVSTSALVGAPVTGLAWWPSVNAFVWARTVGGTSTLFRVTSTGAVSLIGPIGHAASGFAVVETPTPCPPGDNFIRGDANVDSGVNIADVIFLLAALFTPGAPQPVCSDSADFNDDGTKNIADAIFLLNTLFVPASPSPAPPYPACGQDGTTGDPLDCSQHPCP